jgi:membrane fusion protein (multidrug efflux system)
MTTANIAQKKNEIMQGPTLTRTQLIRIVILVAGIALALYVARWWWVGRFIESTDDAYVGGDITVMSPKVAGLIKEVPIADNQQVHAGDLLVKIDDRDYKAVLAKTEASVSEQEANVANLKAQLLLQASVIDQAKASVIATDAEITRTKDDYLRYKALSDKSAAPIQTFQKADSEYKQALANGRKARAAQEAAVRQLDVISTQRQKAEASLAAAKAENAVAKLNVEYTEVRAPIDGTVGNRSARVGSYANIGSELVSIVPAHGLWVDANFKEGQLAHMHAGQPVTIRADILSSHVFHGRVSSLAPATGAQFSVLPAENATGNFTKIVQRVPVRILLNDDTMLNLLRPGLSTLVEVDQRSKTESSHD